MKGSCKCENIGFEWDVRKDSSAIEPRACQCDMCKSFNAAYVSDTDSRLKYWVKDVTYLGTRRSGTGTASFYTCLNCKELVLVTSQIDGNIYAVVNSNCIKNAKFKAAAPISFEGESLADRLTRRKTKWIPEVEKCSYLGNSDG